MVKLLCYRYGQKEYEEYEDIQQAISGGSYMIEHNLAAPVCVEDEQGNILMDEHSYHQAIDKHERELAETVARLAPKK